jgi:TolB-like protein
MSAFLAELKRRKVVRVAVVYAATAFVVLQAADILVPALQLPTWAMSLVVLLLAIGLVVVLAIAWAFDMTPDGIRRTSGKPATPAAPAGVPWLSARSAITALVLVAAGMGTGWLLHRAPQSPHDRSLAVLPFDNLSPDPDHAYFADGMHEEILTALQRNSELRVISRTSALAYRNSTLSIPEIARRLGVRMVLEGSVRRDAGRVRITAQLIDARTDRHVWAENFDRTLDDVFSVQADVAERIATAMRAELAPRAAAALRRPPTVHAEAYQAFLRSRAHSDASLRGARARLALLDRAVAPDPDFGLAHLERFHALSILWSRYHESGTAPLARAALERGAALLPDAPETARARGTAARLRGDLDEAARLLEAARVRMPSDPLTLHELIAVRMERGEPELAVSLAQTLVSLDPAAGDAHEALGIALFDAGRFGSADSAFARALELEPQPRYFLHRLRLERTRGAEPAAVRAIIDEANRRTSEAEMYHFITRGSGAYVRMIERARPATFDNLTMSAGMDPVDYYHARALVAEERGDVHLSRLHADSARALMVGLVAERERMGSLDDKHPVDGAWMHSDLALALAMLGRDDEALPHARRAFELVQPYKGTGLAAGPREVVARIYVRLGMHEEAIGVIEEILRVSSLPPAWFAASPEFEPLRSNARYRRLIETRTR